MGKNEREGERCEILAGKILCYIIKSLVHTSPFRKFTSFLGGSTHFPKSMGYKPLFQIPHSFFPGWIPIWELKSLVVSDNFSRPFKSQERRPEYWLVSLSHTSFFFLPSLSRVWVTWASKPNISEVRQATDMKANSCLWHTGKGVQRWHRTWAGFLTWTSWHTSCLSDWFFFSPVSGFHSLGVSFLLTFAQNE